MLYSLDIFEDTEENKHEYMTIFSQYQSVIGIQ